MEIEVVEFKTEKVVETIKCGNVSLRQAERAERGLNINLNLEDYYTRIIE